MAKMDCKQVRLDKRQHKWLKQTAKARGLPQAEIIREAIDFYIAAQAAGTEIVPAKQKRAKAKPKARSTSGVVRPRAQRAESDRAPSASKWRADDPYEQRLRQIEHLTG
ncbi:MAG: ribbon-helix-helix protein, CopG family [Anaerolineae bacterium]|nr:ribbon-helix-helix protein, CopG family [Thermoflexales bacterium]MDW8406671.1 ribbon-helix-helix protein, CopG family [Anaerolineae bacterium]